MPLPLSGFLSRFSSQAGAATIGFGVGTGLGEALRPEATQLAQDAWQANPSRAVDALAAAQIVAEDVEARDWGATEAAKGGIDGARFDALVGEVLNAPGVGELLRLWRRRAISDADFVHGLRKAKLETRWDDALRTLRDERLDPAVIATAIQRGILDDPGLLPVGPPTETGRVAPMPRADLDTLREAEASGIDRERLAALTRIVGLPPGPGELLQLLNRGAIVETDFRRGIAEGNTRNEWATALLELRRRLLTPDEYAELRLRGWITTAELHAGAALSGMEVADADLLEKVKGRPIPVHQVTTGLARGGVFDGPTDAIPAPYLRSLEEGNIRPEWYNLAYANRYTLPSAFVLRSLVQSGELTEQEGHEVLLEAGWKPALAAKVASRWAAGGAGGPKQLTVAQLQTEYEGLYIDRAAFLAGVVSRGYSEATAAALAELADAARVRRSRDARIARIKSRFVGHLLHEADAASALTQTGIPQEAQTLLLEQWAAEREVNAAHLTPAQIKRAVKANVYTHAEGLAALEDRGYTTADATTLLAE